MKFSHSYSDADPSLPGSDSQRGSQVVPSFPRSVALGLSQGSGEIAESEYSGPAETAAQTEAKKKNYSNTCTRSEIR